MKIRSLVSEDKILTVVDFLVFLIANEFSMSEIC